MKTYSLSTGLLLLSHDNFCLQNKFMMLKTKRMNSNLHEMFLFWVFFYLFAFICIFKSFFLYLGHTCRCACKTMLTNDVIISIRNNLSVAFCFVQSVSSIKHIKIVTQLTTFLHKL